MHDQEVPWNIIRDTRTNIIKKKAEVESIEERISILEKQGADKNFDDIHKARMKLKHVKDMLVELQVQSCEHDVYLISRGFTSSLPRV